MKLKRAGLLTRLVLVILIVAAATGLLNLRTHLAKAEEDRRAMARLVALQSQENAALQAAIQGTSDPERVTAIARSELGLAAPGEIVFYDASK